MKLESCHISGFGRIRDFEYDFSDGLNTITEDNGWGKTTFLAFIKAMLYGLEYSRKRLVLSERKHYEPWDKGAFGGSLVFFANGRRYRIERTFGAKEQEDIFALYDEDSGLKSGDYSEAVGEELFGVDRDSFEKSLFLPQSAPETAMTDSINAKMGNLSAVQDDINRFDAAIKRVEDERRKYVSRGSQNPGLLFSVKNKIRSAREQTEKLSGLVNAYRAKTALCDEKRAEHAALLEEKKELAKKIAYQSKKEQELGAYRQMQKARQQALAGQELLDDFFANGVPESGELDDAEDKERQLALGQDRIAVIAARMPMEAEAARLSAIFSEHPLSADTLSRWQDDIDRIKELRAFLEAHRMADADKDKLHELKEFFKEKRPSADNIGNAEDSATRLTQIDGQLETVEDELGEARAALASAIERTPVPGIFTRLFLYLSLVLYAGGAAYWFFAGRGQADIIPALICVAVASVFLILYVISVIRARAAYKKKLSELKDAVADAEGKLSDKKKDRAELADGLKGFLSGYLVSPTESLPAMVAEIKGKSELYDRLLASERAFMDATSKSAEELSECEVKLNSEMAFYIDAYSHYSHTDVAISEAISRLSADRAAYNEYLSDAEAFKEAQAENEKIGCDIDAFLSRFPLKTDGETVGRRESLATIRRNAEEYERLSASLARLDKDIEDFESKYDMTEEAEDVAALQDRQGKVDSRVSELWELIIHETEELTELSEEIRSVEETEDRIPELLSDEAKYAKEAELLEKSMSFLAEARDRFLMKYMGPLRASFRKYVELILPGEDAAVAADELELDMDLNVRLRSHGSTHDSDYLSKGYRDLVFICARMALSDILYDADKPPLILDDPFTDLDEDKLSRAKSLLVSLSSDRQIIYLTCHGSRAV